MFLSLLCDLHGVYIILMLSCMAFFHAPKSRRAHSFTQFLFHRAVIFSVIYKCNQPWASVMCAHLEVRALKLSINIFNIKLSMSHLIVNFVVWTYDAAMRARIHSSY